MENVHIEGGNMPTLYPFLKTTLQPFCLSRVGYWTYERLAAIKNQRTQNTKVKNILNCFSFIICRWKTYLKIVKNAELITFEKLEMIYWKNQIK